MVLIDKWWKIVLISIALGTLLSKTIHFLSSERMEVNSILFAIFVGYIITRYKALATKDLQNKK